jgi:Transposase domain (DUF772)
MRPREQSRGQEDLFRSRLDQIINMNHELVRLGRQIDWRLIGIKLGEVYTDDPGQPPLPTRLMAGMAILKHIHNLSDEEVLLRWVQNPYFQHFCGEEFFRHAPPFDRSSMTRWRQRMGAAPGGIAAGEPGGGSQERGDRRQGPGQGDRGHNGAGKGNHIPDRCQADEPGA